MIKRRWLNKFKPKSLELRVQSSELRAKKSRLPVIIFVLVLGFWHLPSAFGQDKIVAIVNNDIITQKDLNDFINFMRLQLAAQFEGKQLEDKIQSMKLDLIDRLIEDKLILQEARKNNIKVDENRVKAKVEEVRKNYASDSEFQEALVKQGLTQADIELKIREQLFTYFIIEIQIKSRIVVKPSEVTNFYEQNIATFQLPSQREFESIGINNANLAKELFNKLKGGEELQNLSVKHSLAVNKFSAREGGELKKEIEDVVFKLRPGEVSPPVRIENSYYIFKLNNIVPAHQQSLSEAQDKIYTFLFNKKMQEELAKWLDELKSHSYVKILQN
jgi:parvulin-like peptidyl-prolyl isomerase